MTILKDIFNDGSVLLNPDSITDAPGAPTVKIVKNLHDPLQPYRVSIKNDGIVSCQQTCDRYKAYAICEHTLSVSQREGIQDKSINKLKRKQSSRSTGRNLSDLCNVNKDPKTGKKATKSTSKRKGKRKSNSVFSYTNTLNDTSSVARQNPDIIGQVTHSSINPIQNQSIASTSQTDQEISSEMRIPETIYQDTHTNREMSSVLKEPENIVRDTHLSTLPIQAQNIASISQTIPEIPSVTQNPETVYQDTHLSTLPIQAQNIASISQTIPEIPSVTQNPETVYQDTHLSIQPIKAQSIVSTSETNQGSFSFSRNPGTNDAHKVIRKRAGTRITQPSKVVKEMPTKIILKASKHAVPPSERKEQPLLPLGRPLPPIPPMPEPQIRPYEIKKRAGNVATCHGCRNGFKKSDSSLFVLFREEEDWFPKVDKENYTKQWSTSKKNADARLSQKNI
eukprot:TCONS_00030595-protein